MEGGTLRFARVAASSLCPEIETPCQQEKGKGVYEDDSFAFKPAWYA